MASIEEDSSRNLKKMEYLYKASKGMSAKGGLDIPERQLYALLYILTLQNDDGSYTLGAGSHIILLTDAPTHDLELVCKVIKIARAQKVCISFFISKHSVTLPWMYVYHDISEATGGIVTESINKHSFRNFKATHDPNKCESFYDIPNYVQIDSTYNAAKCIAQYGTPSLRDRRQAPTPLLPSISSSYCRSFNVSIFTTSVEVIANTTKNFVMLTRPTGETAKYPLLYGIYGPFYREQFPLEGEYRVCVATGTLTITVKKKDVMDTTIKYLIPVENVTDLLTSSSPPSPGQYLRLL